MKRRGPFRIFLKQPGGWRILAGGTIVFLLALATLTGSAWTPYKADEMDLDHQLSPPSIPWLKRLMATDEALKMQERNRAGAGGRDEARAPSADDEDLGFLQGGEGDQPRPRRRG